MTQQVSTIDTRRVKYIVKTYNKISCSSVSSLSEIPISAAEHLISIPYEVLIVPFVLNCADKGRGRPGLSQKYGVTEDIIRGIGRRYRGWK